jgi:hypothetical protein
MKTKREQTILCRRDADGDIVGLQQHPLGPGDAEAEGWEPLSLESPELDAFLALFTPQLRRYSWEASELLVDLVQVLIERRVVQFTELPPSVQQYMIDRHRPPADEPFQLLRDDEPLL